MTKNASTLRGIGLFAGMTMRVRRQPRLPCLRGSTGGDPRFYDAAGDGNGSGENEFGVGGSGRPVARVQCLANLVAGEPVRFGDLAVGEARRRGGVGDG